jgi:hypothetical protein
MAYLEFDGHNHSGQHINYIFRNPDTSATGTTVASLMTAMRSDAISQLVADQGIANVLTALSWGSYSNFRNRLGTEPDQLCKPMAKPICIYWALFALCERKSARVAFALSPHHHVGTLLRRLQAIVNSAYLDESAPENTEVLQQAGTYGLEEMCWLLYRLACDDMVCRLALVWNGAMPVLAAALCVENEHPNAVSKQLTAPPVSKLLQESYTHLSSVKLVSMLPWHTLIKK